MRATATQLFRCERWRISSQRSPCPTRPPISFVASAARLAASEARSPLTPAGRRGARATRAGARARAERDATGAACGESERGAPSELAARGFARRVCVFLGFAALLSPLCARAALCTLARHAAARGRCERARDARGARRTRRARHAGSARRPLSRSERRVCCFCVLCKTEQFRCFS